MKRPHRQYVGLKHLLSAQSALAVDHDDVEGLRVTKTTQPVRPKQQAATENTAADPLADYLAKQAQETSTQKPKPALDAELEADIKAEISDETTVAEYDSAPKLPQKYGKKQRRKVKNNSRRGPKADADLTATPKETSSPIAPQAPISQHPELIPPVTEHSNEDALKETVPKFARTPGRPLKMGHMGETTIKALRATINATIEGAKSFAEGAVQQNVSAQEALEPESPPTATPSKKSALSMTLLASCLLVCIFGLLNFLGTLPMTLASLSQLFMSIGLGVGLFALRYIVPKNN